MAEINMDMKVEIKLNPNWRTLEVEVFKVLEIAARNVEKGGKEKVPVDTGATKNSIAASRIDELTWEVGPTTEYAPAIEFGTWKMGARPFMTNTLEAERPRLTAAIEQLMEKL
jgi:HK97 gp10 family phage protein